MVDLTENLPLSITRLASALTYLASIDGIEGWLSSTTALAMIETTMGTGTPRYSWRYRGDWSLVG
jgi:hypothetical protein